MPAWRREAEALIAELLGRGNVPWTEWNDHRTAPGSPRAYAVVSAVGHTAPKNDRARTFAALVAELATDGVLIVVDHNRPRRRMAALRALVGRPWVPGWSPAARWRRLAPLTAQEVQGAGARVERLRMVAGERVQIVVGVRSAR